MFWTVMQVVFKGHALVILVLIQEFTSPWQPLQSHYATASLTGRSHRPAVSAADQCGCGSCHETAIKQQLLLQKEQAVPDEQQVRQPLLKKWTNYGFTMVKQCHQVVIFICFLGTCQRTMCPPPSRWRHLNAPNEWRRTPPLGAPWFRTARPQPAAHHRTVEEGGGEVSRHVAPLETTTVNTTHRAKPSSSQTPPAQPSASSPSAATRMRRTTLTAQ